MVSLSSIYSYLFFFLLHIFSSCLHLPVFFSFSSSFSSSCPSSHLFFPSVRSFNPLPLPLFLPPPHLPLPSSSVFFFVSLPSFFCFPLFPCFLLTPFLHFPSSYSSFHLLFLSSFPPSFHLPPRFPFPSPHPFLLFSLSVTFYLHIPPLFFCFPLFFPPSCHLPPFPVFLLSFPFLLFSKHNKLKDQNNAFSLASSFPLSLYDWSTLQHP